MIKARSFNQHGFNLFLACSDLAVTTVLYHHKYWLSSDFHCHYNRNLFHSFHLIERRSLLESEKEKIILIGLSTRLQKNNDFFLLQAKPHRTSRHFLGVHMLIKHKIMQY